MAYCMLGLCGVNMPLLYGEGEKAFFRLQLEIIKNSDDESIFAWFCDNTGRPSSFTSGMIAHSPENFAKSGHIENYSSVMAKRNSPYSITNKGLAYTIPWPKGWLDKCSTIDDLYLLPLGCQFSGPSYSDPAEDANPYQGPNKHSDVVTICLERKEGGIWQRIHYQDKHICMLPKAWDYMVEEGRSFETIYVQDYGLHCFEDWEKEPSELYEDVLSCGSIRRGDTIICLTHSL